MTHRRHLSLACLPILSSLLHDIGQNLRGYHREFLVDIEPLEDALAHIALRDDPARQFRGKPPGNLPDVAGNFVRGYVEAVVAEEKLRTSVGKEYLGALELDHPDFGKIHKEVAGTEFVAPVRPGRPGDSSVIDFAAEKAWFAYMQIERQILALSYLATAVPREKAGAVSTITQVREVLVERLHAYYGDYLRFALMSSDQAVLGLARKRVAAASFNSNMWLGGYLSDTRYDAGRQDTKLDDKLRIELSEASKRAFESSGAPTA